MDSRRATLDGGRFLFSTARPCCTVSCSFSTTMLMVFPWLRLESIPAVSTSAAGRDICGSTGRHRSQKNQRRRSRRRPYAPRRGFSIPSWRAGRRDVPFPCWCGRRWTRDSGTLPPIRVGHLRGFHYFPKCETRNEPVPPRLFPRVEESTQNKASPARLAAAAGHRKDDSAPSCPNKFSFHGNAMLGG